MKSQLAELRAISGHSAAWCAEHIGHVSKRTWLYWEAGRNGLPPNPPAGVIAGMEILASAVQAALKKIGEGKTNTRRS